MFFSNKKFKTEVFGRPAKIFLFLIVFLILINKLSAQSGFPNEDYWSLGLGIGMSDVLVKGGSFNVFLDPKLWISRPLMVGTKFGIDYSFNEDNGRNILSFESQIYLRWNFLKRGNPANTINIFAQTGFGLVASYRGNKEEPDKLFKDVTMTRGSLLAEAAVGVTIPLSARWHIEPMIRGGYPHIWGFGITGGYKFHWPQRNVF